MKNILMITASVATLVAVGGLASAQGLSEHREAPAAAAPEQKAPMGKTDRQNLNAPQKSESVKPGPTAQAPEGKTDHKLNAPQKSESVKPAPTAQAGDKPTSAKSETVGQGGGTQPSQHNAPTPSERTAPNEAARAESKLGAPAALSTEHHAQFRETIRSEKVAPLNDVRFSVTIGEAVPRTVHLNRLPPRILEFAPQYRGYEYILVGDDILIVDPRTLRIVAVIAA
jgi:Protein of unknown function (DUF1236)